MEEIIKKIKEFPRDIQYSKETKECCEKCEKQVYEHTFKCKVICTCEPHEAHSPLKEEQEKKPKKSKQ